MRPPDNRTTLAVSLLALSFVVSLGGAACSSSLSPDPGADTPDAGESAEGLTLEVGGLEKGPLPRTATRRLELRTAPEERAITSIRIEPRSAGLNIESKSLEDPNHPTFTLRGSARGTHRVQVEARLEQGARLRNSFELEVIRDGWMTFEPVGHRADDLKGGATPPYLTESVATLRFGLHGPEGRRLQDEGRYPVEWSPSDALALDRKGSDDERLLLETGASTGTIEVRSTIDPNQQTIRLVDASMVEDLYLVERSVVGDGDVALPIRGFWAAHLAPVHDGIAIYDGSLDVSLVSANPDVCSVASDSGDEFSENSGQEVYNAMPESWVGPYFVLSIRSPGDCTLTAELPEGDGGNGVTWTATFQID